MDRVRQIPANKENRGDRMLLALSKVSQAFQSTRSPGDVYSNFEETIHELGFEATILSLNDSGTHLTTTYQTRDPEGMKRFSKRIGFSVNDFKVPIRKDGMLDQVVNSGRTLYLESRTEILLEIFPKGVRPLISRMVNKDGKQMQSIIAPLRFGEEILGVIGVSSADLSENEIPAITVFAGQVSAAMMNARAYSALQEQEQEKFRILFDSAPDAYYINDLKGKFIDGNKQAERMTGYSKEELIGKSFLKLKLLPKSQIPSAAALLAKNVLGKSTGPDDFTLTRNDGGQIEVEISTHPVRIEGKLVVLGIARDITERKQTRELLQESEDRYRTIFESVNDGIIHINKFGKLISANDRVSEIFGYTEEDVIGKSITNLGVFDSKDLTTVLKSFGEAIRGDVKGIKEWQIRHKNGNVIQIEASARLVKKNGKVEGMVAIVRDVTERKQTEETLREQAETIQSIVDSSLDWIWEYDLQGFIKYSNNSVERILGYSLNEFLGNPSLSFMHEEDRQMFERKLPQWISEKQAWRNQVVRWKHKDGSTRYLESSAEPVIDRNGQIVGFRGVDRDITERKKVEDQINRQLDELRILQEISSICLVNVDEYETIAQVTKAIGNGLFPDHFGVMLLDEKHDVLRIHESYQGITPGDFEKLIPLGEGVTGLVAKTNSPMRINDVSQFPEYVAATKSSQSELCVPISLNGRVFGVINAESFENFAFTEADEQMLTTVADQLALALQKIRLYQSERVRRFEVEIQHEISSDLASSTDLQTVLDRILGNLQRHFEYDSAGILLQENGCLRIVATHGFENEDNIKNLLISADVPLYQEMIKTKTAMILENVQIDDRFQSLDGIGEDIQGWMGVPLIDQGEVFGYVTFDSKTPGIFNDEMARLAQILVNQTSSAIAKAKLYEETQLGIKRLEALHEIDRIIISSVDLSFAIKQIMEIVVSQLEVDTANVMTFDSKSLTFNPINSNGVRQDGLNPDFLTSNTRTTRIALEQKIVRIEGQDEINDHFDYLPEAIRSEIKTYVGVPLIAKGETKGILELFHNSDLDTDLDWERFLKTLTAQLAIAIDNSQMFENLQRSHLELTLSYEATIEGWAKTLELRDQETQGHSERVTSMTVKLAQALGMNNEELIHVRRGALLHDVGKIGIPDNILQKPGKLDEEERSIMENHPTLAFNVLSGSVFLEKSLDIPYCHHEKWDGSGYPKGLKGEEIPFSARVFAIIDVYDALRSDRPYRKAWSKNKTLSYIKEQTGCHFDPQVVEAFLSLADQGPEFNVYDDHENSP